MNIFAWVIHMRMWVPGWTYLLDMISKHFTGLHTNHQTFHWTAHFTVLAKMGYSDWYPDWSEKAMKICNSSLNCKSWKNLQHWTFAKRLFAIDSTVSYKAMSARFGEVPQLQALICEISAFQQSLDSVRFLMTKLKEHFKDKGIFFQATYVTTVRDWSGNMNSYATTFGAYRKRYRDEKIIPHSFTFVRRDCCSLSTNWALFSLSLPFGFLWPYQSWFLAIMVSGNWGLPQHLLRDASNSLPRRYSESSSDVILLIKRFVSDRELSQPPLIVWPGDTAQEGFDCLSKIARNEVNRH